MVLEWMAIQHRPVLNINYPTRNRKVIGNLFRKKLIWSRRGLKDTQYQINRHKGTRNGH